MLPLVICGTDGQVKSDFHVKIWVNSPVSPQNETFATGFCAVAISVHAVMKNLSCTGPAFQ